MRRCWTSWNGRSGRSGGTWTGGGDRRDRPVLCPAAVPVFRGVLLAAPRASRGGGCAGRGHVAACGADEAGTGGEAVVRAATGAGCDLRSHRGGIVRAELSVVRAGAGAGEDRSGAG